MPPVPTSRPAALPRPHLVALTTFTVLGAGCLIGTFLPWLRTGARTRSSYELFGLVERLGFAPGGWIGLLIRCWPLVPLLVTTAVVLTWWRRLTLGLVLAVCAALYAGGVSVAILIGASGRPIDLAVGTVVCPIASGAFLLNAMALQVTGRLRIAPIREPPIPSPHADSR